MAAILWSGITRDGVILAEAGQDERSGAITTLAQKLLKKRATAGWEFASSGALKGLKFHLHENTQDATVVWSFACVYDASLEEIQAKGFLEKLTFVTEPLRSTPLWLSGGVLACQESCACGRVDPPAQRATQSSYLYPARFLVRAVAPTLLQRMEQVASMGRLALASRKVDEVKELMGDNIELLLARGDKIEELDEKASAVAKLSQQFRKGARSARRQQMWNNARMGVVAGTAVTVGVGIIVVPPLVALL